MQPLATGTVCSRSANQIVEGQDRWRWRQRGVVLPSGGEVSAARITVCSNNSMPTSCMVRR